MMTTVPLAEVAVLLPREGETAGTEGDCGVATLRRGVTEERRLARGDGVATPTVERDAPCAAASAPPSAASSLRSLERFSETVVAAAFSDLARLMRRWLTFDVLPPPTLPADEPAAPLPPSAEPAMLLLLRTRWRPIPPPPPPLPPAPVLLALKVLLWRSRSEGMR